MARFLKISLFLTLLLAFFACAECVTLTAEEQNSSLRQERELAEELLSKMFFLYSSYARADFSNLIAEDFQPLKNDFINYAEATFYHAKVLEMNYFLKEVAASSDTLAVKFKWEKKIVPLDNPQPKLLSGESEFVFKLKDGVWFLYNIKQDNPFTAQ